MKTVTNGYFYEPQTTETDETWLNIPTVNVTDMRCFLLQLINLDLEPWDKAVH